MKGVVISMMNCIKGRTLTHNESLMLKEVSKSIDIKYLTDRLAYIQTALVTYARFGLNKFKGIYPNLPFTFSEMRFYCLLLEERLKLLNLYHDREQKIYEKL